MDAFEQGRFHRWSLWIVLAIAISGKGFAGEIPIPERSTFKGVRVEPAGVSINAKSALLRDLLTDLCRQSGIHCSGYHGLVERVDVFFQNVPLEKALIRLLGGTSYVIIWAYDFSASSPSKVCRPVAVWVGPRDTDHPTFPDSTFLQTGDDGVPVLDELASRLFDADSTNEVLNAAQLSAAMGTPEAVRSLFDALEKMPDGDLRENVIRIAGSITNAAAAPVLSDVWLHAQDAGIARAAAQALARMVDGEGLRQLREACEQRETPEEAARFIDLLQQVSSPAAEDVITKWTGEEARAPATALEAAAWTALSRIGTGSAANRLIERANSVPEAEALSVYEAFNTMAPTPPALAALRYAAEGNKLATHEATRLAALQSLARFPDGETVSLVQRMAADPSARVQETAGMILREWDAAASDIVP